MVTAGFNIHPAFIRPIAVGFALAGCYLRGCGLYDLFIDHDTAELFSRVRTALVFRETDADRFHHMIAYRLLLGLMLSVLAYALRRLHRLHRWWNTYP